MPSLNVSNKMSSRETITYCSTEGCIRPRIGCGHASMGDVAASRRRALVKATRIRRFDETPICEKGDSRALCGAARRLSGPRLAHAASASGAAL